MKNEAILYAGTSYYFDGESFRDPQLVCLSDDLDAVLLYLAKLRGYIVVDTAHPTEDDMAGLYMSMGDAPFLIVADVAKYRFEDAEYARLYAEDEKRANYVLTPHGGEIDRRLSGLNKKESKTMMVPAIVERIIDAEYFHFYGELEVTLYSLKRLLYYVGREKEELNKIGPLLFKVCEFIEKLLQGKTDKLADKLSSRNPILFCSEPEYRRLIKVQEESESLQNEYRRQIENDDRTDIRKELFIDDDYDS